MPRGRVRISLCWKCQHAVPNREGTRGCSWSRESKPVEGWDAEPTTMKGGRDYGALIVHSFHVKACPQFLADEKREIQIEPEE